LFRKGVNSLSIRAKELLEDILKTNLDKRRYRRDFIYQDAYDSSRRSAPFDLKLKIRSLKDKDESEYKKLIDLIQDNLANLFAIAKTDNEPKIRTRLLDLLIILPYNDMEGIDIHETVIKIVNLFRFNPKGKKYVWLEDPKEIDTIEEAVSILNMALTKNAPVNVTAKSIMLLIDPKYLKPIIPTILSLLQENIDCEEDYKKHQKIKIVLTLLEKLGSIANSVIPLLENFISNFNELDYDHGKLYASAIYTLNCISENISKSILFTAWNRIRLNHFSEGYEIILKAILKSELLHKDKNLLKKFEEETGWTIKQISALANSLIEQIIDRFKDEYEYYDLDLKEVTNYSFRGRHIPINDLGEITTLQKIQSLNYFLRKVFQRIDYYKLDPYGEENEYKFEKCESITLAEKFFNEKKIPITYSFEDAELDMSFQTILDFARHIETED